MYQYMADIDLRTDLATRSPALALVRQTLVHILVDLAVAVLLVTKEGDDLLMEYVSTLK